MGQPSIRGSNFSQANSQTSHTVSQPAGTQEGDLLAVFFFAAAPISSVTSGWNVGPVQAGTYSLYCYWRWAAAGSNTMVIQTSSVSYSHMYMVAFGGLDATLPGSPLINSTAVVESSNVTSTILPGLTAPRPSGICLSVCGVNGASTISLPSGTTLVDRRNGPTVPSSIVCSEEAASSKEFGPYAFTTSTVFRWTGLSIFIGDNNPAPVATVVSPGQNAPLDRALDVPLVWAASDETAVLTSDVRYRRVGDPDWITQTGIAGTTSAILAGALPPGMGEWQVRANDSLGPGDWSEAATFYLADATTARRDASLRALVRLLADPATDAMGAQYLNEGTGQVRLLGPDGWVDLTPSPPDVQVFIASGTWTKPTGAKRVTVIAVGAGGGGGCGYNTTVQNGAGGGGGGAALGEFMAGDLPGTVSIVVGAGGLASVDSTRAGSGGASSFGTLVSGLGGAGGMHTQGGTGGGNAPQGTASLTPASNGAWSGGNGPSPGNNDGTGLSGGSSMQGGGGGGGAGGTTSGPGGAGGVFGGAGGDGGTNAVKAGGDGVAPGGGGGGNRYQYTGSGGDGARGEVTVITYF